MSIGDMTYAALWQALADMEATGDSTSTQHDAVADELLRREDATSFDEIYARHWAEDHPTDPNGSCAMVT